MTKSVSVKGLSIVLALALLCSMGLMALILSSPSTVGAQPWSMYFAQTYVMEDGDGYDQVWISIMNEDQTITHVQLTNEDDSEDVEDPSIAIAPNGNIIVAWQNTDGPDYQIHYAVLNGSGAVIKSETALDSNEDAEDPCVAVTPDEKVFIVWEHDPDGDDPVAYVILDTAGNILSAQTDIFGSDDIDDPTVGTSTKDATNNNVVIAWEEDDGDEQVWFTILNSSGGVVVASTQVTSNDVDSENVNVAVLPGGNFAIVWDELNGGYWQVWFTIRAANGSIVKANTPLTTSTMNSNQPGIATAPGGNSVIVWTEGGNNILYTIMDGSGNEVKSIVAITSFDDSTDGDVAIDKDGNTVVSSQDGREDPGRVSFSILSPGGTITASSLALTDGTYQIDLAGARGTRQVATQPGTVRPVGGEAFSPDKMAVMAPWITLAIAITAGTGMLVRRRRTAS